MKNIFIALFIFLSVFLSAVSFSTAPPDGHHIDKPDGDALWKQNCSRCHLPPNFSFASFLPYSPGQKKTVIMHMRMVANLTGDEADAIYKFLTK